MCKRPYESYFTWHITDEKLLLKYGSLFEPFWPIQAPIPKPRLDHRGPKPLY